MSDATTTGIVAGESDCEHPESRRTYLGNMGPTAMYRCDACGGIVLSGGDQE